MAYQGSLDGLCGPYAIVNAYHQCDIEEDWLGEDLFAIACLAIKGWPHVLWEGTSLGQMIKMLKACQDALQSAYEEADTNYPIDVRYPFLKNSPGSNEEYWKRFDEIFSRDDVICGIIGMAVPSEHWFAFDKRAKTLTVFDSTHPSDHGMRRLRIEDIHAGVYEKKKYVICRRELIVFSDSERYRIGKQH